MGEEADAPAGLARAPAGPRARTRAVAAALAARTLLEVGLAAGGAAAAPAPPAFDLRALAPGTPRAAVEAGLAAAGARALPRGPRELRVEAPLLPRVFARQRARIELDAAGRLERATLELVPPTGSRGEQLLALYDEALAELQRTLGRPVWQRRQGSARRGEELWALARGELVRTAEWRLPHPVRLAIPRRLDGELVVEIAVAVEPAAR